MSTKARSTQRAIEATVTRLEKKIDRLARRNQQLVAAIEYWRNQATKAKRKGKDEG